MREIEIRRAEDLGLAVAESRLSRGLTQAQLAEESGIERTYLAKLESGLNTILVDRTLRLLRRLGARVVVELPDDLSAAADPAPRATG
jgi:transcriptional regulator with XRE-family HTH domain